MYKECKRVMLVPGCCKAVGLLQSFVSAVCWFSGCCKIFYCSLVLGCCNFSAVSWFSVCCKVFFCVIVLGCCKVFCCALVLGLLQSFLLRANLGPL